MRDSLVRSEGFVSSMELIGIREQRWGDVGVFQAWILGFWHWFFVSEKSEGIG